MSADDPAVRFVGGSTGPEVRVCTTGAAETNARIGLQFGDALSAQPSFGVKVVEERFLKLYVTPVYVMPGQYETLNLGDYEMLHRVYAQAGITVLVVQEAPLECKGLALTVRDSSSVRRELRGKSPRRDGKVVYVLPFNLVGATGFAFGQGSRELAVGMNRNETTLPHEIGHTLGLFDMYTDLALEKPGLALDSKLSMLTSKCCFVDGLDWNAGAGERYYPSSTSQPTLVKRHLMYGVKTMQRRDLTVGNMLSLSYDTLRQDDWRVVANPTGVVVMRNSSALQEGIGVLHER